MRLKRKIVEYLNRSIDYRVIAENVLLGISVVEFNRYIFKYPINIVDSLYFPEYPIKVVDSLYFLKYPINVVNE